MPTSRRAGSIETEKPMDYPKRKHPRLKDYDYSQPGAYFVTICTKNRRNLLGNIPVREVSVESDQTDFGRDQVILTEIGEVCRNYLERINVVYASVQLPQYVIMPNHIHLLLSIEETDGGMRASRPTVSSVVRSFKTMVTKQTKQDLWQASFYEHVIRNEHDYLEISRYICENPMRWKRDKLFAEQNGHCPTT